MESGNTPPFSKEKHLNIEPSIFGLPAVSFWEVRARAARYETSGFGGRFAKHHRCPHFEGSTNIASKWFLSLLRGRYSYVTYFHGGFCIAMLDVRILMSRRTFIEFFVDFQWKSADLITPDFETHLRPATNSMRRGDARGMHVPKH